jgi:hypothetical protein
LEQAGIRYFCSDEDNLFRSLANAGEETGAPPDHLELFQGWRVLHGGATAQAVFREKPLSDFIGFMAAKNSAADAANHLLTHLRNIALALPGNRGIIPLILDGENAWETFADGGQAFLRLLYAGLVEEPLLHSSTIEKALEEVPPSRTLAELHTGSWISSDFDIWIGEEEENRAWNLLGDTREFLERRRQEGGLDAKKLREALFEVYAAEGSDWFWWYGPDFSTENDALFDELFRQHLKNVYTLCGHLPPAQLEEPITAMRVAPLYSRPERPVRREVTGRRSSYFDWMGAGCYVAGSEQGAMYRSDRVLKQIHFGNDSECLYLRLDPAVWKNVRICIEFHGPRCARLEFALELRAGAGQCLWSDALGECNLAGTLALLDVVELALPLSFLGGEGGEPVRFQVKVLEGALELECYPERVPIEFNLTRRDYALEHWMV